VTASRRSYVVAGNHLLAVILVLRRQDRWFCAKLDGWICAATKMSLSKPIRPELSKILRPLKAKEKRDISLGSFYFFIYIFISLKGYIL
jgi:hypothetical protein